MFPEQRERVRVKRELFSSDFAAIEEQSIINRKLTGPELAKSKALSALICQHLPAASARPLNRIEPTV